MTVEEEALTGLREAIAQLEAALEALRAAWERQQQEQGCL